MKSSLKLLLRRQPRGTPVRGRVLFVGQCYYNSWYLSRELRKLGWRADLLNFDEDPANARFYHGEDYVFATKGLLTILDQFVFYLLSLFCYDVFVFANTNHLKFGNVLPKALRLFGAGADIRFLRLLGKKIVYINNGCLDGVSQSAFSRWQPYNVCSRCHYRNSPEICSDERNLAWGRFRNSLAHYQGTLGGNRVDCNDDPRVHEAPWFYSLDKNFWKPDMLIPSNYLLPIPKKTVKLYHAVGNFELRSGGDVETIKSTHIYLSVVERLKSEGFGIEMIFFKDVPNQVVRYYQAQADIFLDMLTFGFFGANVREAMMLGKPAICFLRPEWLQTMRKEIPDYVAELPVVSATPETVYSVLKELILDPAKRLEIGRRSRAFAEKWHASDRAAEQFDRVFSNTSLSQTEQSVMTTK